MSITTNAASWFIAPQCYTIPNNAAHTFARCTDKSPQVCLIGPGYEAPQRTRIEQSVSTKPPARPTFARLGHVTLAARLAIVTIERDIAGPARDQFTTGNDSPIMP